MSDWTDRLKSRKFLIAIFGTLFVFLTEVIGVNISTEAWNAIVTLIIGYIGIEGAADVVDRYGTAKANIIRANTALVAEYRQNAIAEKKKQ